MPRGGSPLFELFVRVREEGIDAIDKKFAEQEKKFADREKSFDKFNNKLDKFWKDQTEHVEDFGKDLEKFHKDEQKREKTWLDSLSKITDATKEYGETFDKTSKTVEDGSKRQTSALGKLGDALGKIQDQTDKLNKGGGIGLEAQLKGGDELTKQLTDIQKLADSLKDTEITIRTKIEGADEVIKSLERIGQLKTELTDSEVVIHTSVENGPETVQTLEDINTRKREIGAEPVEITVDSTGLDQLNTDLNNTNQQLSSVRDTGTSAMQGLGTSFGDADSKARTLASGIGGSDSGSVRGSIRQMDADAHAANALPTLLGDAVAQLTRFKTVAAGIAVSTIPTLIAGVAGAASGIAVLAAGAGALATALSVGLAGAAAAAGGALIGVYANIALTAAAASSAIGNILGLDKGMFSLGATIKEAEKEVKAFNDLVAKMPAGTEAARAAQERLAIAQEKQQAATQLQITWWNKYGDAANDVARNLNTLHLGMVEIVNEIGGRMIPVIQDFTDIAVSHLKDVALAGGLLSRAINDGTIRIRDFLKSAEGMSILTDIFEAIGRSAEPTFTIISNGLVIMLRVLEPIIPLGYELLRILADAAVRAANFADSARGIEQIAEFWRIAVDYAKQLAEAIGNITAALGNLGVAFIQSGLADQMIQGFVEITQQIRDATSGARDADSAFRTWLEAAKPILAAARDALTTIVVELFKVVDAVTRATDPSTGLPIMVEILNGIRDAAAPLGRLLVSTFEDLGPIIAELLPNIAQFLELFLGSTPELVIFLSAINDLLTAFNALPDPVQKVAARILALTLLFGPIISSVASLGTHMLVTAAAVKYLGLTAGPVGLVLRGLWSTMMFLGRGVISLATTAIPAAIGALGLLGTALAAAALAAVIFIVVEFDYEAANEAYDAAIENGESTGSAWGDYFLAGLEGIPIFGEVVKWIDDNIAKPIDDWVSEHEGIFGEWFQRAWDYLAEKYTTAKEWLQEQWDALWTYLGEQFNIAWQQIVDELTGYWEAIKSTYDTYVKPYVDAVKAAWDDLLAWTNTQYEAIKTWVETKWQEVQALYTTYVQPYVDSVKAAWDDLLAWTNTQYQAIKDWIDAKWAEVQALYTTYVQPYVDSVKQAWDDLWNKTNEIYQQLKDWVTEKITEIYNLYAQYVKPFVDAVTQAFGWARDDSSTAVTTMRNNIVSTISEMVSTAIGYIEKLIGAIGRMYSAMRSSNGSVGPIGASILRGAGGPAGSLFQRAKGGIDENAELQPSVGGISSGVAPRVVYGEQQRKVPEAYIVADREDNVPFLATAASWFDMALVPKGIMGMATGGLASQVGKTYSQVPHIPPPEPVDSGASQSTVSGTTGGAGATAQKKPSRRQRRRQRRRERRQSRTTASSAGTSAASPTSGAPSAAPSTGAAPSTPSAGSTPTMGTPSDTGTGSPSQQAFPSSCGNLYPVASPTASDQVPYRDAALSQSGMVAAISGGDVGADHVNAPANMTHPGDASGCGIGGSGSSNMPYPSTPLGSGAGAATIPYNQCLPAHVTGMATGGTTGASGATDQAYPLDYVDTPLGYWSSALGYAWPGDPAQDWPTLFPPAGWDPSVWYYTGANGAGSTGMARGGILKGGVRHFQGGGLNTYQLEAGDAAASGVLGSPYSYGHAGDDGGFDCSGLWQYIYTAVVDGAPTPDVRWWGTYAWAGGYPGGEGVAGPIDGAMNVYVDLTGWEGDDTHMSGDILGNPYEAIFSGVTGSSSAAGNDGIWSIGDPASIGQWGPVTPDYSVDPAATMSQEVSDWWLCQAPAPVDIGTAPMFGPVESWMADLPGMTEPFLQQAGQESIGTLGSGGPGVTPGTGNQGYQGAYGDDLDSWIIHGLQATGYDTTEDAVTALRELAMCESSGDPNVTSPDGAMGLFQLMPATWDQFNVGGDPYDPIASAAASINYQLSRYGELVSFCPYEKGGIALAPHLGMVGEAGRELMLPLDNSSVMSQVRAELMGGSFASEEMVAELQHVRDEVRNVAARVDHQTRVVPPAIGGAMDSRIEKNPGTNRAMNRRDEREAMKQNYRGVVR